MTLFKSGGKNPYGAEHSVRKSKPLPPPQMDEADVLKNSLAREVLTIFPKFDLHALGILLYEPASIEEVRGDAYVRNCVESALRTARYEMAVWSWFILKLRPDDDRTQETKPDVGDEYKRDISAIIRLPLVKWYNDIRVTGGITSNTPAIEEDAMSDAREAYRKGPERFCVEPACDWSLGMTIKDFQMKRR